MSIETNGSILNHDTTTNKFMIFSDWGSFLEIRKSSIMITSTPMQEFVDVYLSTKNLISSRVIEDLQEGLAEAKKNTDMLHDMQDPTTDKSQIHEYILNNMNPPTEAIN